jgi:hypothetical protein
VEAAPGVEGDPAVGKLVKRVSLVTARLALGRTAQELQHELENAEEWFRYQPGCWLLISEHNTDWWYGRLERFVKPSGDLLIARVSLADISGFMSEHLIKWIEGQR